MDKLPSPAMRRGRRQRKASSCDYRLLETHEIATRIRESELRGELVDRAALHLERVSAA
jgi:hypothetical protein